MEEQKFPLHRPEPEELMSLAEAAAHFDRTLASLHLLIEQGKLEFKQHGQDILVSKEDVRRALEEALTGSAARVIRRLYTVADAGLFLSKSKEAVYKLCQRGVLPSVKDGRRRKIDVWDLEEYVRRLKRHAD